MGIRRISWKALRSLPLEAEVWITVAANPQGGRIVSSNDDRVVIASDGEDIDVTAEDLNRGNIVVGVDAD